MSAPHDHVTEPAGRKFASERDPLGNFAATRSDDIARILTDYTAVRPSRRLGLAFTSQSLVTGIPLLLVDAIVTALALLASAYLVDWSLNRPLTPGTWNQLPVILLLQLIFLSIHQMYPGVGDNPIGELRGLIQSTIFSYVSIASVNALLYQLPRIEFVAFLIAAITTSALLPIARSTARSLLARTTWWGLRAIVIGDSDSSPGAYRRLSAFPDCGYRPVASQRVDESEHDQSGDLLNIGEIANRVANTARLHNAPVVVLSASGQTSALIERLIFVFPSVLIYSVPTENRAYMDNTSIPGSLIAQVNRPLPRLMPRITKRLFDLSICIPLLFVLSIPFLLIGLMIKVFSPGPVFYGDPRIGQHGKRFRMWKFRTMVGDANDVLDDYLRANPELNQEWQLCKKLKKDPRVIPIIGSLMRRFSIDELPQLWNVITGEMSLVGPRPMPADEITRYSKAFFEYTNMTPGLTGLWQVSGRNNTAFQTRVMLVEYYAQNWSLWLDVWILARTPSAIIRNEGAY